MAAVILTVIGFCFTLGALDFILGGRLKLAPVFSETFSKMGNITVTTNMYKYVQPYRFPTEYPSYRVSGANSTLIAFNS
jgi:ethanolamine transporter EutH